VASMVRIGCTQIILINEKRMLSLNIASSFVCSNKAVEIVFY
jgi:hypothetical protein